MKTIGFSIILFLFISTVLAQHSGNTVIAQQNKYNQAITPQTIDRLYLSDTSFIIQANVLLNVIADTYVATFGVSESSNTLKGANMAINERIQKFISALAQKRAFPKRTFI